MSLQQLKKIVVFGAQTPIGRHLIRFCATGKAPYRATAVVRTSDDVRAIKSIATGSRNITTTKALLEECNTSKLRSIIRNHDAVVFAEDSDGENFLQIELDGAVKTYEAAVDADVRRYIMLSTIHAEDRDFAVKVKMRDYYIAKHYADRILVNEFGDLLDYTIMRPSKLTDDPPTGKIQFVKNNMFIGSITRQDVAECLYNVIDREASFRKVYDIANGTYKITLPYLFR